MERWIDHEGGSSRGWRRRGPVAGALVGAALLLAPAPAGAYDASWTAETTVAGVPFRGSSCLDTTSVPPATSCVAVGLDPNPSGTTYFGAAYYGTSTGSGSGTIAWSKGSVPGSVDALNGVSCATTSICTAAGDTGSIARTTNGGASWTAQRTNKTTENLYDVTCTSSSACLAVGYDTVAGGLVMKTTNSGGLWTKITGVGLNGYPLAGISCSTAIAASTGTCTASAYGGFIFRTANGGNTWTQERPDPTFDLLAVSCNAANDCITFSNNDVIYRSVGGSATWSTIAHPVTDNLSDISCSGSNCKMVGYRGAALTSSDGGANWTTMTTIPAASLTSVSCTPTRCRAVGDDGTFTDGVIQKA